MALVLTVRLLMEPLAIKSLAKSPPGITPSKRLQPDGPLLLRPCSVLLHGILRLSASKRAPVARHALSRQQRRLHALEKQLVVDRGPRRPAERDRNVHEV